MYVQPCVISIRTALKKLDRSSQDHHSLQLTVRLVVLECKTIHTVVLGCTSVTGAANVSAHVCSRPLLCGTPTHCVVHPLTVWYTHSLCGTPTHCVVHPLTVWYTHSLCGTPTPCMVHPLPVWYTHSLYGTPTHGVVHPLTVWYTHSRCGTPTHCVVHPLTGTPINLWYSPLHSLWILLNTS